MANKVVKFPRRSQVRKAVDTTRNRKHLKLLLSERMPLQSVPTLDDYVFNLPDQPSPKQEAFLRGLSELSFAIREALGRSDIYIGRSVIGELLYNAVVDPGVPDPIEKVFAEIVRAGVAKPGILAFALTSIGIAGFGLFRHFSKASLDVPITDAGLVLTPQTNSFDETHQFLNRACHHLGIEKTVDAEILAHYHRSRPVKWLRNNPLIVRIT